MLTFVGPELQRGDNVDADDSSDDDFAGENFLACN